MSEEITLDAVGRRYPIEKEVGRGGMSVVYKANDPRIGRKVAVKLLHPHLASRADARRRFLQEATAIAMLENPYILKVYDYDSPDDQTSYIISEFVEGVTLKQWVELNPIKHWEVVALFALPLFKALAHAHQQGIIHRDVKPENIMIRAKSGAPVLMDFGIAHIIDSETLTATGAVIGSPAHMAPEVVNGETLTCSADLFSMGTVLYWMTCGSLPFVAPNPAALFRRILEVRFDPVKSRRPEVLTAFADIIERCMRRDPAQRPESASLIVEELEELLSYGGLFHYGELLGELSHDPTGFQAELPTRLAPQYCEQAEQALRAHHLNLADTLIEQAYLFDPDSHQIIQVRNKIGKIKRKRRSFHFSVMSLTALMLGAVLTLWLGSLPIQDPDHPISENLNKTSTLLASNSTASKGVNQFASVSQNTSSVNTPLDQESTLNKSKSSSPPQPNQIDLKNKKNNQVKERLDRQRKAKQASLKAHLKKRHKLGKQSISGLRRIDKRDQEKTKQSGTQFQKVKVSSRYKGAQIFVDGTLVGHVYQLDTSGGVKLSIGSSHEILFRSPFCEEQKQTLFLKKILPQSPQIVFECVYKPATIMIHSQYDAEVLLDGLRPRLLGRTNQVITYPLKSTGTTIKLILMRSDGRNKQMRLALEAGQRKEARW